MFSDRQSKYRKFFKLLYPFQLSAEVERRGLSYGHGATVAYGSPKPLIWVRILVPVLINLPICTQFLWDKFAKKSCLNKYCFICTFAHLHICAFFLIMNKFTAYLRDSYKELVHKVTWPNWDQLQQSTMIVLGSTLLITGIVWVMDFVASNGMKLIYSFFN